MTIPARLALGAIRLYQLTLSSMTGGACRFVPSCSAYAAEAVRTHGALRGGLLAIRRLSRCHPLGGSGLDQVPPRRSGEAASASSASDRAGVRGGAPA